MRTTIYHKQFAVFCVSLALYGFNAFCSDFRSDIHDEGGKRLIVISSRISGSNYFVQRKENRLFEITTNPIDQKPKRESFQNSNAELSMNIDEGDLVFASYGDSYKTELKFKANKSAQRFDLAQVQRSKIVWMHNDEPAKSPTVSPNRREDIQCKPGIATISSMDDSLNQFFGTTAVDTSGSNRIQCGDLTASVKLALGSIKNNSEMMSCLNEYAPDTRNSVATFVDAPLQSQTIRCTDEAVSAIRQGSSIINLGKDFTSGQSQEARTKILFHEALHHAVGERESLVAMISACCFGAADAPKNCSDMRTFKRLRTLFSTRKDGTAGTFRYEGIEALIEMIAQSNLSADAKTKITEEIRASFLKSKTEFDIAAETAKPAIVVSLNSKLSELCLTKISASQCATFSKQLDARDMLQVHVGNLESSEWAVKVSKQAMKDQIGKTQATTATTSGPPVPQNLEVRPPDANRLRTVQDQMDKYSRPFKAATEELGSVTRSFVANFAPVTTASATATSRSTTTRTQTANTISSDGSFSVSASSVVDGKLQLNLNGNQVSGSIPFSDTQFGKPEINVVSPDGTLTKFSGGTTTVTKPGGVIPGRISRIGQVSTSPTGSSGDLASADGGTTPGVGSGGGGSTGRGGSASTPSKTASSSRTPSGSGESNERFQTETRRMKTLLVKSQDPVRDLRAHERELREIPMIVIYNGARYPSDLKSAPMIIDLNRYRGER